VHRYVTILLAILTTRVCRRHEVADDSFGFVLPVEDVPEEEEASSEAAPKAPSPEPPVAVEPDPTSAAPTPNTSAKRRPLEASADTAPTIPQPPTPEQPESAQPSSASKGDPYDLGRESPREEEPVIARSSSSLGHREEVPQDVQPTEDTPTSQPSAAAPPSSRSSAASRGSAGQHMEEVTESPAGAPGSGHRRRVRVDDVITQSAQLQRMVMDEEARVAGEDNTSSPLARKTRQSGVIPSTLSVRSRRMTGRSPLAQTTPQEPDELSPAIGPSSRSNGTAGTDSARSSLRSARRITVSSIGNEPDELSSPVPLVESRRRAQAKSKAKRGRQPSPVVEEQQEAEEDAEVQEVEEAEEISVKEAARHLGRKRRRPSPPREASPELDSRIEEVPQPAKKRRQKRAPDSPAKQAQPKVQKRKKKSGEQREPAPARSKQSGDREHVSIAVQRYTRQQQYAEGDTDTDILASEIPFANRGGVNVVDVLSQMCDEVIDSNMATLHEAAVNAKDAAAKKEYRTKLRALEAFQEELRTRLLEHVSLYTAGTTVFPLFVD
jgi:hypothetical protein